MLERTGLQTLWWFLGHRVTVVATCSILTAALITVSAVASGTNPTTTVGPSRATETDVTAEPTAATIALTCTAFADLAVTATGEGWIEVSITGPAAAHSAGENRAIATFRGPAGTYAVQFTATERLDKVSWYATTGGCSG